MDKKTPEMQKQIKDKFILPPPTPLTKEQIKSFQEYFKNSSKRTVLLPIGLDVNIDECREYR